MRCHDCPNDAGSHFRCAKCRAARALSNVRWRAKVASAADAANLCRRCAVEPRPADGRWCDGCRQREKERRVEYLDRREEAAYADHR